MVSASRTAGGRVGGLLGLDGIPPAVRPLVAGSLLQSLATSGFSSYVGIWAVQRLGAPAAAVGVALFLRAGSGVLTGYLGGSLSDRIGRRVVIVAGWLAQALCILAFVPVQHSHLVGLGLLVAFGPLGPPAGAAAAAYVADVTTVADRQEAYAAMRAATSLAVVVGPPAAALLVLDGHWARMFAALGGCSALAVAVTWRSLGRAGPRGVVPTAAGGLPTGGVWRDQPFLAFLGAATLITVAMAATDRVLPIAAVSSYHLPPSAWGALVVLNPLLVVLLQVRLTRATDRFSRPVRIVGAAVLTGFPFLLLLGGHDVTTIAAVVVLSTFGEMLWSPTAQALAAELAPADRRGAYQGAFGGAVSMSFAVGPMMALLLRDRAGDAVMWLVLAGVALVGAVTGVLAVRARPAPLASSDPSPGGLR